MPFICARFSSEPDVVNASNNSPPMRQGAKGEGVRTLQLGLIDLGFAMPNSTNGGASLPDGIFGPETLKCVIAFQRANGLEADGIAGAQTFAKLDALIAAQSEATARADVLSGNKSKGFS
jgi:peptidoglycan hydrolase-like protein with peptidoglycan-binding domain